MGSDSSPREPEGLILVPRERRKPPEILGTWKRNGEVTAL